MRKESSLFFPFPSGSNLSKVTKSREQNKEFILFLPRRSKFGEARVTKSRWKNQEKYHFAPSFHVFATAFQALSPHCCKMRRLSHVIFEKRKKKVGNLRYSFAIVQTPQIVQGSKFKTRSLSGNHTYHLSLVTYHLSLGLAPKLPK